MGVSSYDNANAAPAAEVPEAATARIQELEAKGTDITAPEADELADLKAGNYSSMTQAEAEVAVASGEAEVPAEAVVAEEVAEVGSDEVKAAEMAAQ